MKNITGKTLIFYTFQDRKEKEHNVTTFKKSAPQEPKIRDVLYELPLDFTKNSYHFRFKSEFFEGDEKIIGWIDISNLLAKVPIINNTIFVKILTLPEDHANKLFNREKLRAIGLIDPGSQAKTQTHGHSLSQPPIKLNKVHHNNISETVIKKPQTANKVQGDLLGDMDNITTIPTTKTENQIPSKKQEISNTSNKNGDLFEMNMSKKKVVPEETTAQRLKGFQDNHADQMRDRDNELIAEKQFEQKLLDWGYSGHKIINNLTTLLATLHEIWPEWEPVSLTSMLNQDDVNALFKKAVIKVHPDKNRRKDFRTKYLAKRVFQLLNEAKKAQQQQN